MYHKDEQVIHDPVAYLLILQTVEGSVEYHNFLAHNIKKFYSAYVNFLIGANTAKLHKEIQLKMNILKSRATELISFTGAAYVENSAMDLDCMINLKGTDLSLENLQPRSLKSIYGFRDNILSKCIEIRILKTKYFDEKIEYINIHDVNAKNKLGLFPFLVEENFTDREIDYDLFWYKNLKKVKSFELNEFFNYYATFANVLMGTKSEAPGDDTIFFYTVEATVKRLLSTLIVKLTNAFLNPENQYSLYLHTGYIFPKKDRERDVVKLYLYLRKLLRYGIRLKNWFILDRD